MPSCVVSTISVVVFVVGASSTFAVAMQENATNLLSVGTLQDSVAQMRANAYRTYRFSTGALKSNTVGYLWPGSSGSYACTIVYEMPVFTSLVAPLAGDPLALNLSDSTSIRLKSANFSFDFSELVFYFQCGLHLYSSLSRHPKLRAHYSLRRLFRSSLRFHASRQHYRRQNNTRETR